MVSMPRDFRRHNNSEFFEKPPYTPLTVIRIEAKGQKVQDIQNSISNPAGEIQLQWVLTNQSEASKKLKADPRLFYFFPGVENKRDIVGVRWVLRGSAIKNLWRIHRGKEPEGKFVHCFAAKSSSWRNDYRIVTVDS